MIPPALSAALDAAIESPWDELLVIADYLDDAGEPLLAWAYRWMAENEKQPQEFKDEWDWLSEVQETKDMYRLSAQALPMPPLYDRRDNATGWFGNFPTQSAAYLAAASEIIKPEYELTHNTKGSK